MRRPLIILPTLMAAVSAMAALGCEDGPAQTYSPSPPGAGNIWNSGNPGVVAADAGQSFDAGYPTVNKTTLCSTDFKRQRWAWMLTQPIVPPRLYAGLDIALNDQWDGLTIDAAESAPSSPTAPTSPTNGLCQSNAFGFEGECPSGYGGCNLNSWGNNNEVIFSWNVATHLVDQMELQLGYTGSMKTVMYPDHNGEMHSYSITVGDVVRRDEQPYEIDWNDSTKRAIEITDIFNATMAGFAANAGIPFDTSSCTSDSTCNAPGTQSACQCKKASNGTDCVTGQKGQCGVANCYDDGNCLVYNDGSTTIFGVRPMVVYVEGNGGIPQPALSTPQVVYNFFSKFEPYSNLPQVLKLDANGPVAKGVPVGVPANASTVCTQQIGQTFADLTTNCVQVHGDKGMPNSVDDVNLNKITHSLTHDQEHWTANVLGVNQNFTSAKVAANPLIVVLDNDAPQPGDVAQDFTFDVRARGHDTNDWSAGSDIFTPGSTPTLAGSSMLMIEWAHLMLVDIARILGTTPTVIGDPRCVGFSGSVGNYVASNAPGQGNPGFVGCSGIEGLVIPNGATLGGPQTDFSKDPGAGTLTDIDPTVNYDWAGFYEPLLKPGTAFAPFCIDPAQGQDTDCDASSNSMFQNALLHVIRVLGRGQVNDLPSELQDRRYYFKWFGVAYIKYLKAFGNYSAKYGTAVSNFPDGTVGHGMGPSDVRNQTVDLESLFFDYSVQPGTGAAQTFDKFEYIDRDFIGQGAGGADNYIPWDFEYGNDLFGGNQRYDNWYRRMDREEIGMFSAMLTDKTHTPGQENNVNITNLFGSGVLATAFPTWACAVGQAGPPESNGCGVNAPLDPTLPSGAPPCGSDADCSGATPVCGIGKSFENGYVAQCGAACDFTANPTTGCASPSQTCVNLSGEDGCVDMKMDKNAGQAIAKPLLWNYPGAWQRTPFGSGHSPISIPAKGQQPNIGVAQVSIPNYVVDPANPFTTGPYTISPILPGGTAAAPTCPTGYKLSDNKAWCNGNTLSGTGTSAAAFTPLAPWLSPQPGVGFSIPLDAQHSQWLSTGQIDFTGVLESYIVDYVPYVDVLKPSCVEDHSATACNTGFKCDLNSDTCVTTDDTIQIQAIEGTDFLGQAFVCQDPATGDILHVGMYDSAIAILDWFEGHPGNQQFGPTAAAIDACGILVIRSPADNYVDFIVSKTNGVALNMSGGAGLGRVTDIVLFDPTLIQAL